MKLLAIVLALVSWCAVCLAQPSANPPLSEALAASLRSVLPVDAKLTRQIHRRFWQQLSSLPVSEQEAFTSSVGQLLVEDLQRQRAMWRSIRETLIRKTVVVLPDYDAANARMRAALEARSLSTARLDEQMKTFAEDLGAIAAGEPIFLGDKQALIDLPMAETVLAGVDGSYARVRRLLDPKWKP